MANDLLDDTNRQNSNDLSKTNFDLLVEKLNTIIEFLAYLSDNIIDIYNCMPVYSDEPASENALVQDDANSNEQSQIGTDSEAESKNEAPLPALADEQSQNIDNGSLQISDSKNEESTEPQSSNVLDYFEQLGYSVKSYNFLESAPAILINLATTIGNNYEGLNDFLKVLRTNATTKKTVSFDLKKCSANMHNAILKLCSSFYQIAFFEQYNYYKAPRLNITFMSSNSPKYVSFITGSWLEMYVANKISSILNEEKIPFELYMNVKLQTELNDQYELDIILKVKSQIYWFECKSSSYQSHIRKYSEMTSTLNIPCSNSFLIVSSITSVICSNLQSLYNINVCNMANFEEKFREIVLKG